MATLRFANGTIVDNLPARLAQEVVGIDADGDLLVPLMEGSGDLCPLTPCCHGSGKGAGYSSTGVVCRGCYTDVDVKYGGLSTLAAIKVA